MYDLVIRGGEVVDGSGMPGYRADVAIQGDRIARVGRVAERGAREIDAEGHVVTPGFIDAHTHMDAQINWDGLGASSCYQGVTTAVMGNCGFTLAPSRKGQRDLIVRNLERAEDISADAMREGIKWDWETFPEYLDVVDRLPKGINYAAYLGHSALRTWAMGERAFEERATDDDLAAMSRQLQDGMAAGAFGFSTSRSNDHRTPDGGPVASCLADWEEVCLLTKTMAVTGKGVFELAKDSRCSSPDPNERAFHLRQLEELAVESGVPMTFGITIAGARDRVTWSEQLDLLDRAAARGGRIIGQTHSRDVAVLLSFRTSLPFDKLPVWRDFRKLSLEEQEARLRQPEIKARLVEAATNATYGQSFGAEARKPAWNLVKVYTGALPPYPTIADLAQRSGSDPAELMIGLALEKKGLDQFFIQQIAPVTDDDILEIIRHKRTIMTFSDAGAHVSQISDSSIHAHLLAYWTREKAAFTLEEAVRMISSAPALTWGFANRGLVHPGFFADLNVIDPATVAPQPPQVLNDLPGGGRRLFQNAVGFRATIVNGKILMKDGEHCGSFPGRLLRK